jgi:hypothetical protein
MRSLLLLLAVLAGFIAGCASDSYRPGLPGVRDVPKDGSYYNIHQGTIANDWTP